MRWAGPYGEFEMSHGASRSGEVKRQVRSNRMSRRIALTTAVAIGACGSLVRLAQAHDATSATTPRLAPPVVHERFTHLPCSGAPKQRTILEEEGCVEQQILASDAQINALARSIFALLGSDAARRRFIAAQASWLTYRRADCDSESDLFEGGTLAAVIDATCSAERNAERVKDLRAFRNELARNR